MPNKVAFLKREICDIGRRMWDRGFCAGNDGNCSCRIGDNRVLATPTGVSKGFMSPAMMTLVDGEGRPVGRQGPFQRTSEIMLHLAIYRKRSDVGGVVHAHAPHATAFACAGVALPTGVYPEAEVCLGHVPTVRYSKAGYKELGESVMQVVQPGTSAVLLGNHGVVTFGKTLVDAFYKLEMVEAYCRILLLLKQIGRVNLLSAAEMAELMQEKRRMGIPVKAAPARANRAFFRGITPV